MSLWFGIILRYQSLDKSECQKKGLNTFSPFINIKEYNKYNKYNKNNKNNKYNKYNKIIKYNEYEGILFI